MSGIPERQRAICQLDDLQDTDSRGFTLELDGQQRDLFVVRQGRQVFAYLNSCPHTGGPMDWVPDRFLSLDNSHIQCATHDALFRITDGYCVAGPCSGEWLTPVPVRIEAGEVVLVS